MQTKYIVSTLVTFCLFTFEAILHYSVGHTSKDKKGFSVVLPGIKDALKIAAVVMVFSILSVGITHLINNYFL